MVARVYGGEEWYVNDDGCGRAECLYERAGTRVHATRFIIARRVGDDRWERHGDERGVDDEYDGGQEDDYMYENQREGSGEARETARGGADDAMEGRRAVEGGGLCGLLSSLSRHQIELSSTRMCRVGVVWRLGTSNWVT